MEKELLRLEEAAKFCCIAKAMHMSVKPEEIIGIHAKHINCNGYSYFIFLTISEKDIDDFQNSENAAFA